MIKSFEYTHNLPMTSLTFWPTEHATQSPISPIDPPPKMAISAPHTTVTVRPASTRVRHHPRRVRVQVGPNLPVGAIGGCPWAEAEVHFPVGGLLVRWVQVTTPPPPPPRPPPRPPTRPPPRPPPPTRISHPPAIPNSNPSPFKPHLHLISRFLYGDPHPVNPPTQLSTSLSPRRRASCLRRRRRCEGRGDEQRARR